MIRKLTLIVLSALVLLTGCSGSEKKDDVQGPLKVMFFEENSYFNQYGELFAMEYPNVEVEVIGTNSIYSNGDVIDYSKGVRELIEREQPDVVMLNENIYQDMVEEAALVELDALIERDKYNIDTIYPPILDMLREKGGGKLYGFSPTFYKNVIYYNEDLFKEHGIDPPHDGMTWQELLELAQRFPSDGDESSRVYGFGMMYDLTPFNLVSLISYTEGLTELNIDTLQLTVNTESWKKVYELAIDTLNANILYTPQNTMFTGASMDEYYMSQPFLAGRMAMTWESPFLLQQLKTVAESVPNYKPFKLGMAAGPVDPMDREATRDLFLTNIFAIRSGTSNADAAWAFLKYISGDKYAKAKSKTMNPELLSRVGDKREMDGYDLEVFYKLKPKSGVNIYAETDKIPPEFFTAYRELVDQQIQLVRENSKSLDDALTTLQNEGHTILDNAMKEREMNETQKEE